jgi:hypothetical protein
VAPLYSNRASSPLQLGANVCSLTGAGSEDEPDAGVALSVHRWSCEAAGVGAISVAYVLATGAAYGHGDEVRHCAGSPGPLPNSPTQ